MRCSSAHQQGSPGVTHNPVSPSWKQQREGADRTPELGACAGGGGVVGLGVADGLGLEAPLDSKVAPTGSRDVGERPGSGGVTAVLTRRGDQRLPEYAESWRPELGLTDIGSFCLLRSGLL